MRKTTSIKIKNISDFKEKLLYWAQQYDVFVWMDSNNYRQEYSKYDAILAIGVHSFLDCNWNNAFDQLKYYQKYTKDYIFGYLAYDLKNEIENLSSKNHDGLDFSDMYFFQPKKIFYLKGDTLEVKYLKNYADDINIDLKRIKNSKPKPFQNSSKPIWLKQRISKEEYTDKLKNILNHIHRGDIYEVNFCLEFFSKNTEIDPLAVYQKLNDISTPPYATFLKLNDKFLLSASPERFVKKQRDKIISQPIKGTARRLHDYEEDNKLVHQLFLDPKERAENIMIVDLVRNDLSKTAIKGSVNVEKLCEAHTFKQVHQLVSTVISEVDKKTNPVDIVKSLFPMGSMTGAPKISAMKIIEDEEETKRGLYSGAVGYFTPNRDFDFNVVIRSVLYNKTNKYVSFSVGGAITAQSNPENEYEECLLKAKAMKKALKC